MQAIDLLAEMFQNAKIRAVPRLVVTPGSAAGLRKGELGKVQGVAVSNEGVFVLECNNATLEIHMALEGADACKVLAALECNYPHGKLTVTRERIGGGASRDGADLALLGRMGKS